MAMQEQLRALQKQAITFAEFVRATRRDWGRLGEFLLRKWPVPAAVTLEDVEQELLMSAWRATLQFDGDRGAMAFERYVVWMACTDAKKYLHKQRNAHRRRWDAGGRYELPLSVMRAGRGSANSPGEDRDLADRFDGLQEPATQEGTVEARESLDAALRELPWAAQRAAEAFLAAGGDTEAAASEVFGDPELRLRARLGSERDARRLVARAGARVLEKVERAGA